MRSPSTAPAAGLASALQADTACSLALAAAVAATAPAPHPDAALIAIGERWRQTQRDWLQHDQAGGPTPSREHDAAGDAIFARDTAAVRDAAATPAAGLLGLAVKARMFAREADHLMDDDRLFPTTDDAVIATWAAGMRARKDWTRSIIGSLVADLLRLGQHDGLIAPLAMLPASACQDDALLQHVADYWTAEEQRKAIYAAADASFRQQNAIDEGAAVSDAERAEAAAGIARFHDQADVVEGRQNELIRTLAVTSAATAEGLRGKAQIAIDDMTDGRVAWLTGEHIPELLSRKPQATDIHPARNLALVMSVLADAAGIGMPPVSAVEAEAGR